MSFFNPKKTGVWLIDVQEKLFKKCDRHLEVLEKLVLLVQAASTLELPLFVTEHCPEKLGATLPVLKQFFPKGQRCHAKKTFSGYHDPNIRVLIDQTGITQWILVGIEAHICVLQTAKDLIASGKEVCVLNDAVTARSLFDFSTAIGEMRDYKVRISSVETVIYELLRTVENHLFPPILSLVKQET